MDSEDQILIDLVNAIRTDIVNSMQAAGRNATGQTVAALEIVDSPGISQLWGPDYLDILERGRGPTSPDAPPGDPLLIDRIKEWCQAKGIDQKLAYPITKKIHEQGYAGKPGVFTEPLSDDNINRRADEAAGALADLLIFETLKIES